MPIDRTLLKEVKVRSMQTSIGSSKTSSLLRKVPRKIRFLDFLSLCSLVKVAEVSSVNSVLVDGCSRITIREVEVRGTGFASSFV